MTDIEDLWRDQRATASWLMDMLSRGRDPIASLEAQLQSSDTGAELQHRMNLGVNALILAAVPDGNDTHIIALQKRNFIQRANAWKASR